MKRTIPTLTALLAAALVVAGCGGASDAKEGGGGASAAAGKATLSLVAYPTPQVVYDEIIPAFNRTPAGEGIGFKTSFGASGDQSRAVEAGQKADVVTFSTEPDVTRLVKAGLVAEDWNTTPTKGLVTTSLVSFIVRKGNPKRIRTWADLVRPGRTATASPTPPGRRRACAPRRGGCRRRGRRG